MPVVGGSSNADIFAGTTIMLFTRNEDDYITRKARNDYNWQTNIVFYTPML
jgi:hypothetical protein